MNEMRPRYFRTALLLGAFFVSLVAVRDMAAQATDEHGHEREFYTCGSDWARGLDHEAINEATRLNSPEVYAAMVAAQKQGHQDRPTLAGTSAVDEFVDDFFLVNRSTGQRETVIAVSKFVAAPWVIVWVDVRDTGRISQATIDQIAVGLIEKVKPGSNTRDPNTGVIQNDIAIFGDPPRDKWSDGEVVIHLLLLDIDNGSITGGTLSGYFSPLDQTTQLGSNEMNVLYIDSPQLRGVPTSREIENVLGTVAHEFQHLINHRQYTDNRYPETHWLYNEGLSEVASLRNGYSDRNASIFFNSPNEFAYFDAPFGDSVGRIILAAYERGMMMTHYLSEQYGDGFLNRLVAAPGSHIEPIQWALQQTGFQDDAKNVWSNFWVANYLQNLDNPQDDPRYKYRLAVAGRSVGSVAKSFPDDGPRVDEMTIKGYTAFVQRYVNPVDSLRTQGIRVRFHPNSREYRAHAVLLSGSTVIDVRPLTIDQEYTFEGFTTAVMIINSLDGGDAPFQWTVERTWLGVEEYSSDRGALAVTGAVPNPALDQVRFNFRTAEAGDVTLELFDVRGEAVLRPIEGRRFEGGEHSVVIDVADLPPGVYTARLQDGSGAVAVRQIVVVK